MRAAHPSRILATLAFAVLGGLAIACVREGTAVVAPVEVTIENGDGGPAMPLVIAPPSSLPTDRDRCTAVLRAQAIKTNPGCTLDERLSHGNGTLLYPCVGDGTVEAIFGEHHFLGRINESAVTLALGTELDWEDGCHWETKQVILGSWNRAGAGASGASGTGGTTSTKRRPRLSWSYSEAPVTGSNCYGSCTATADIEIAPEDVKP